MIRLSVLLVLCTPCWGQEAVVELMDSRIRAADIFPDADAAIDLGPAPAPGVRRRVTGGQIARWARQAGVAADAGALPEELTLVRKLRNWPESEVAETLRALLAEEAGAPGDSITVDLQDYSAREVPAGRLEWALLGLPDRLDRPVRVSLRWRDPGGRSGGESVTAMVQARGKALVAKTDLPSGAEIRAEDFELTMSDLESFRHPYLADFERDGRWTLMHEMKAGEPLRSDSVARRADVERGAVVELVVTSGAVRLRAPGRAEGSGSAGDLIPFRNLATNQRVLARVTDSRTAEAAAQ